MAQILRDPRFETLRIFYTRRNRIIHHTAISSLLPDIIDFLRREYINDGIRSKARSQEASGPLQVFAETDKIERMSADGSSVVATDTAANIEQFFGSDFNNTLYGGSGTHTEIHGGLGNDTLYGEKAGRLVDGGQGDDVIYAGTGGSGRIATNVGVTQAGKYFRSPGYTVSWGLLVLSS